MSFLKAEKYLTEAGFSDRILVREESTATVALAAAALGTTEGEIAKTLSFLADGKPFLVVMKGDARIQNHKFKEQFHTKASMIPQDQVETLVGHEPGGVCPFGINPGVPVYLDISLKQYDIVYPAAGDDHSAVRLTPEELYKIAGASGWVDVCKNDAQERSGEQ